MLKIITPLLLVATLPLLAQTPAAMPAVSPMPDAEVTTTVTKTMTTEQPVATPMPATSMKTETTETTTMTAPAETEFVEGVIAEINQGANFFTVIAPKSSIPMKFMFNENTTMANLQDEKVMLGDVKLGQAVTVTYITSPDHLMATNVALGDPDKLVPVDSPAASSAVSITTGVEPAIPVAVESEETTTTTTTTESE